MITDIKKELRIYADKEKVLNYQRFFKTGPGEYGEGDKFLGVTVPNTHIVVKKFSSATFDDIKKLLGSIYHEERLAALFISDVEREMYESVAKRNFYTSEPRS